MGCLFLARTGGGAQWDAVKAAFESEALGELERRAVLSRVSRHTASPIPALICACFGACPNVIRAALARGSAASVEEIGVALRAGNNCGSCLPELKRIVSHDRVAQTA